MSEFEDDGPSDEEVEEARQERAVEGATVQLHGLPLVAVEAAVQASVAQIIARHGWVEQARKEIVKAARDAVAQVTPVVVRDQLSVEIQTVIADGIPEFERYDGKEKKRTSIRELIVQELTKETGDRYSNGGSMTLVARVVKATVESVFNKELSGEVEKARAALRTQLDAVVSGKLADALKSALGVR